MATVFQEGFHTAEYIVSEASGYRSREEVTISTGKYEAGTVLGMVTATKKYKILAPAAADGTEKAAAILYQGCDATGGDVRRTVTARDSEVNGLAITWPAGITGPQKATAIADLAAVGIIVRS